MYEIKYNYNYYQVKIQTCTLSKQGSLSITCSLRLSLRIPLMRKVNACMFFNQMHTYILL